MGPLVWYTSCGSTLTHDCYHSSMYVGITAQLLSWPCAGGSGVAGLGLSLWSLWLLTLLQHTTSAYVVNVAASSQGAAGYGKDAAGTEQLTCKPQGLLQFESGSAPRPAFTPAGGLPACPQFKCSCCTRQHGLAILRSLAPALSMADSVGLSRACAEATMLMACRVCDPQVGVGLKPNACQHTCTAWHAACHNDYFTFDVRDHSLTPCPAAGPSPGAAPCSLLGSMAQDGQQLCELAGLAVSTHQPCYDGSDPEMPAGACIPYATTSTSSRESSTSSSRKPKHKKRAQQDSSRVPGWFWSLVMFVSVVWLVPRAPRWWAATKQVLQTHMPTLFEPVSGRPAQRGRVLGGHKPRFARPGG